MTFLDINGSFGMSNSAFRKHLLEATGKSPGQYRADEIVLRACAPLLQTNDILAAIAADLGRHDAFTSPAASI